MSICLQFCFSTPCSRTKPVCSHVFHMLLCPHLQVQLCSLYPLQILPFPHLGFLPCAASCSHVPAQNPLLWLHLTHVVPHTVYQVLIIFCVNLCLPQFHVLLQQASLQQLRKKGSKKKIKMQNSEHARCALNNGVRTGMSCTSLLISRNKEF